MSLPSMRTLDPTQHQQQMASNLPPVAPMAGGPYYHSPGGQLPPQGYHNVTSDPHMRYALPATDQRVMSGGRHKKVRLRNREGGKFVFADIGRVGDQAADQDWLPDVQEASHQGQYIAFQFW